MKVKVKQPNSVAKALCSFYRTKSTTNKRVKPRKAKHQKKEQESW